jgi:DNA-binding NarL/FixJ family response regulator
MSGEGPLERRKVYVFAADAVTELGLTSLLRSDQAVMVLAAGEIDQADVAVVGAARLDEWAANAITGIQRDGCPRVLLVLDEPTGPDLRIAATIGAAGVLRRRDLTRALVASSVYRVGRGQAVVPDDLVGHLLAEVAQRPGTGPAERPGLSEREVEVLGLLADGRSTAEIGDQLGYSERTIKGVVHDITTRLQLRNRSHAVAYALRRGMI